MANEIKTMDDLRRAYPTLVNEIEETTAQQARNDEHQRIQDIEGMALPGGEEQAFEVKYTKPIGASTYAEVATKKTEEQGNAWLSGAENGAEHLNDVEKETPRNSEQDEFVDAIKSMDGKEQGGANMSMDLAKGTFSTQPDYPITGTAEIVTAAKKAAATLKHGAPMVLDSSDKLAAMTVSGSTGNHKTEAIGLYGILTENIESGEQGVVYLSGELFADALVLPTNGSAADLEIPFRAPGIFLK